MNVLLSTVFHQRFAVVLNLAARMAQYVLWQLKSRHGAIQMGSVHLTMNTTKQDNRVGQNRVFKNKHRVRLHTHRTECRLMSLPHMKIQRLHAVVYNRRGFQIVPFVNLMKRDIGVATRALHGD